MKRLLKLIVPFAIFAACSAPSATNETAPVPTTAEAAVEPVATPTPTPTPEEKPMSYYENKVAVLHTGEGEPDGKWTLEPAADFFVTQGYQ